MIDKKLTLKVLICNAIIVALSIVAIVTLWVGSFMKINLTFNMNGEALSSILDEEGSGETPNGEDEEDIEGSEQGLVGADKGAGEGSGLSSEDKMIANMLSRINTTIPLYFDFKTNDLLSSVVGDSSVQVRDTLSREVGGIVDSLMDLADDIMASMVSVIVDSVVIQAEEEIEKQLQESADEAGVTEEQIKEELESEYGIGEDDVELLKDEISEAVTALLNGGNSEDVTACLENSETLTKLMAIIAKEELKEENGEVEPTQEQIDLRAEELKDEVITECDEAIQNLADENGEFNTETAIVSIFNNSEIKDENGNTVVMEDMDDVKEYLNQQINKSLDEETVSIIGLIMKIMGIFVLVVMASWIYIIVKIIVKLFMKNKSVGMFFPRMFGWMPHVIFVGLPMLVFGYFDKLVEFLEQEGMAEIAELTSLVSINISSLTWISALCSALLTVILIPYYQWRRQIKRQIKGK